MHIGEIIRLTVKQKGLTTVWLARQLSCSRTNVYKIYAQHSLDTNTLRRISIILKTDFFALYSEDIASRFNENNNI